MRKPTTRRNRRSQTLAAQITEQVVGQVSEALAVAPEPEAAKPRPLCAPRECRGAETCGLISRTWSGLPVWRCGVCGFQTFDKAEAATRAAVVGRSIIGAEKLENPHG